MHTFPIRRGPRHRGRLVFNARGRPTVWVADVTHGVNARMANAFTGDGDYTVETLQAHRMDHGEMILPNKIHNLARYASWMSLFEAADHCFERRLQKHDAKLGRR